MNLQIEQKKLETELLKVTASRSEMELRLMEREAELQRLRDNLVVQQEKEAELQARLDELKSGKKGDSK